MPSAGPLITDRLPHSGAQGPAAAGLHAESLGANVYNCSEIVYKTLSRFHVAHATIRFGFRPAIPVSLDCFKNSATYA